MYILGLNIFSHDTSAAIFYKKKIIAAIEEERLVKEKHTKQFPIKSIQACLKEAKIKNDNDKIMNLLISIKFLQDFTTDLFKNEHEQIC